MDEKNSLKPMLVKKPVRTAKTPRAFPGQPAEMTPRGTMLIPRDVFLAALKGELDPERTQEIMACLQGTSEPKSNIQIAEAEPGDCGVEALGKFEAEIESKDHPQVFVVVDNPAYVRVVIAKFAVEELCEGSGILVAGAKIPDDQLVGFIRSLMTIAHRRGLVCHL